MIVLDNLKKTYVSKNGQVCNALNGISLSLPEKGMVFVIGQSGSGKSTLLNLLGGLDSITEGEIIVDGVKFSNFKEKDYDNYRKSYVGFVFQDYCLIENMTIYQNIRLGLDLQGEEDSFQVDSILRTVGLQGYGRRYPRELSGGQKQRIGIARALVKNPKLILADEPTGNLDSKISTQVLDFLKEISKNKLVIIVSHNHNDAMKYADRIIELDSGLVVSDTSRVDGADTSLIENKKINLPLNKKLSKKELEEVNVAVNAGGHEIVQVSENFVATKAEDDKKSRKYYISSDALSFKGKMYLSRKFMKGNGLNLIVTSICVSLLIILLSICQIFMTFSGNELTRDSITEETKSITISKGYRKDDELSILWAEKLVGIDESEIKGFYDAGYKGNIYKLYNINMPVDYSVGSAMISGSQIEYKVLNNFYLDSGRGVLECNKEFLTKVYGKNGELKVLAGDINDNSKKAGLIITDYFADSLLYYNKQKLTSYADIVSATSVGSNGMLYQVKAIIETDYKEKYSALIDAYTEAFSKSTSVERKSALAEIKERELYAEFREDLISYLSIGYYFGSDYESAVLEELGDSLVFYFQNPDILIDNKEVVLSNLRIKKSATLIESGKMAMGTTIYNSIFKTTYGKDDLSNIEPFALTINEYTHTNNIGEPDISKDFEVISYNVSSYLYLSEEDFETFARHTMMNYSLYFDNPESFASVVDSTVIGDYFSSSDYYRTIFSVLDVVNVFSDFFLLLFVGLAVICAMLICSCVRRTVRRKFYDIGVVRALGGRNSGISFAFVVQIMILALSIIFLSIGGMCILDNQMNTLLVENLADLMIIKPISGLVMISFDPLSVFFIVLAVLSLCLISLFTMIGLCRKVKPIYIIRKNNL